MTTPNPFATPPAAPPAAPSAPSAASTLSHVAAANPFAAPPPAAAPAAPNPFGAPPPVPAAPPAVAAPPAPAPAPVSAAPPPAPAAAPPPAAAAPPPAPPAAPAAPTTSAPPAMPGAPAMPGMRTPGSPGTAGANRGALSLRLTPTVTVKGTYRLRVKRFVSTERMKNPVLVFEVWDQNELEKMKRGEKGSAQGAEVDITLWNDNRSFQLFRDLGYADDTWTQDADGSYLLPIARVLAEKPSAVCEVDWREGNTPGRGFYSLKSVRDPQRSA